MGRWVRRARGAVGMGLTWAVGWALAGVLIGGASMLFPGLPWEIVFDIFDAPLPALAVPGFVGGAVFSTVLGIAGRRRRFDELSLPRFAAWGAIGGVLLALIPDAMVFVGLATATGGFGIGSVAALLIGPMALLCSASATGSLVLARLGEDRDLMEASAAVTEVGPAGEEMQRLLGDQG